MSGREMDRVGGLQGQLAVPLPQNRRLDGLAVVLAGHVDLDEWPGKADVIHAREDRVAVAGPRHLQVVRPDVRDGVGAIGVGSVGIGAIGIVNAGVPVGARNRQPRSVA